MTAIESKAKTLAKGTKAHGAALSLPGFVWVLNPDAPKSGPLHRALAAIGQMPEAQARKVIDGRTLYSSAGIEAALTAARDVVIKDDGDALTVSYRGAVWFETNSRYQAEGVPAQYTPPPAPVDLFTMVEAGLRQPEDLTATTRPGYVWVTVALYLHGLPDSAVARRHLSGYVPRFSDVERMAETLSRTKYAQTPALVSALEIEVRGSLEAADEREEKQVLTLWFPASNDRTAEGYGVTVSTPPHEAAVARKRAAARLEAMGVSKGGKAVTVAERAVTTLAGNALDPVFTLIENAPGFPPPGVRYVAHFTNGSGNGVRPVNGGADFESVQKAALAYSNAHADTVVRVYRFEIMNTLTVVGAQPRRVEFAYIADGSGRVLSPDARSVDLVRVFVAGQAVKPEAYGKAHELPAAPPAAVFLQAELDREEAPAAPPRMTGAGFEAEYRATFLPQPEAPRQSSHALTVTFSPLDLAPVAALYYAARDFIEGAATLTTLDNALGDFERACMESDSK